ncbi:MAG: DUF917 family protein [Phycisphaerales bacterium]|nr:DUF917 family protein [Phycisphaerales bacterium]
MKKWGIHGTTTKAIAIGHAVREAQRRHEDPIAAILAVGPGKRLDNGKRAEMSVKKGDTVVYGKYAGSEIEIKGEDHLILRETELLGVIDG